MKIRCFLRMPNVIKLTLIKYFIQYQFHIKSKKEHEQN